MPETTKLHPKQPVAAALASRAAVRPALRQGGAFALGLAGGWAVLYGALLPFGLGLTLGWRIKWRPGGCPELERVA